MKKNFAIYIMLIIFLSISTKNYSKPYYFYTVENKEGTNSDVYAHDLENNKESLFLSGTGTIIKLWTDDNQERIYLLRHRQLEVYNISDTSQHYVLIGACEDVGGIVYLDKLGLLYISWTDPSDESKALENDEDVPARTGVFDTSTFKLIKILNEEIIIDDNAFASEDQSMIYITGYEPEQNLHIIQSLSTATNTIVAKTIINNIEPKSIYKLVEDGEKGFALIGYNFPTASNSNNYYMVYDLTRNVSFASMHFPYRSKGFIIKSKQTVIAEEVVIDGKIRAGEYTTGNISVFNYNTGKLIKHYSLPPGGELLVFKNFPDQLYYLTQDKQSMTLPLKLTSSISSVIPVTIVEGNGSFKLTVKGMNFELNTKVQWNGQIKVTNFVQDTILIAEIPASDITKPGKYAIEAANPDGSTSNSIIFKVLSRAEAIDSLILITNNAFKDGKLKNKGIYNSLSQKLENAKKSIQSDNLNAAKGQLSSFVNELDAQKGKGINEDIYFAFSGLAEQIIASINK